MATDDNGETANNDILRAVKGEKTKNGKIKFLAGELVTLADRVDMLEDRADALERKQESQQAWGDNFDRVMALVENKVRKVQEAVAADVPAKTDIEVLRAHCSRLHRENCDLANVLTRVQQEVAQLAESVRKDTPLAAAVAKLQEEVVQVKKNAEGQTGYVASISLRVNDLENVAERFQRAAPALDPQLAKYLEVGGKYLLVEPVDSAAGREWKAAVLRETENDDAPDEYGNAFAASPGEAVAALVAKLVKFKEL